MKLLLCKLCEYSTQLQNGRHSMVGIFDNIVAPFFPIDHPPVHLCVQMEFEHEEAGGPMDLLVKLVDDDAKSLLDFNASGEIPSDEGGAPVRLFMQFQIPTIRFERPGNYRLDVFFNGSLAGEERVPVLLVQQPLIG